MILASYVLFNVHAHLPHATAFGAGCNHSTLDYRCSGVNTANTANKTLRNYCYQCILQCFTRTPKPDKQKTVDNMMLPRYLRSVNSLQSILCDAVFAPSLLPLALDYAIRNKRIEIALNHF